MPEARETDPFQLVHHGPGGTPFARLSIAAPELYVLGRDDTRSALPLDSPLFEPQHFAIRHDAEGLTLLPHGPVTLNGFRLDKEARLANGDMIVAGPYGFMVICPTDAAPYPRGRIRNTLWSVRQEAEGWNILEDTGIYRELFRGFNEVFVVVHDDISESRTLPKYLDFQHFRSKRQLQDYRPEILPCEPLFGDDEAALTVATLTFNERRMAQLQYYGVHGKNVAIASRTVPPASGTREQAIDDFKARLPQLFRFH